MSCSLKVFYDFRPGKKKEKKTKREKKRKKEKLNVDKEEMQISAVSI